MHRNKIIQRARKQADSSQLPPLANLPADHLPLRTKVSAWELRKTALPLKASTAKEKAQPRKKAAATPPAQLQPLAPSNTRGRPALNHQRQFMAFSQKQIIKYLVKLPAEEFLKMNLAINSANTRVYKAVEKETRELLTKLIEEPAKHKANALEFIKKVDLLYQHKQDPRYFFLMKHVKDVLNPPKMKAPEEAKIEEKEEKEAPRGELVIRVLAP